MSLLLPGFVLSAFVFGLAYYPILNRLTRAFVSPYAKADLAARASAVTIDGLLLATLLLIYRTSGAIIFPVAGLVYLLLRDAMWGRSVGKFCMGLMVMELQTGRHCGIAASARRNCLL